MIGKMKHHRILMLYDWKNEASQNFDALVLPRVDR